MKTGSRFNYNGYQLEITLIEYNDIAQDFEVHTVCVGGDLVGTKKIFSGTEFIQAEKTGEIETV